MRRARVLVLVLLAGACAMPEPPLSYPPAARERMLRIAIAEWRDWGSVVLDPETGAPADAAESRPENFPRVLAYWRAVPDENGAIARNRARYREGSPALWSEPPWSATFISYVLRGAGVDGREFPPSAAHSVYVDALIADALRYPDAAPFVPHDPDARAPQVGDLVCADRSAAPIRAWRDRAADAGRFRPMHCDIVVRVRPGHVDAIGGNVREAVTLARFPTDASGVLLPRPPGGAAWFAVFENRLGRLPPHAPSPAPRSPTS